MKCSRRIKTTENLRYFELKQHKSLTDEECCGIKESKQNCSVCRIQVRHADKVKNVRRENSRTSI
jgi:hypothetical protein